MNQNFELQSRSSFSFTLVSSDSGTLCIMRVTEKTRMMAKTPAAGVKRERGGI
jgi:hypothetical protein